MPRIHFSDAAPEQVARRLEQIRADEAYRRGVFWRAIGACALATLGGLALIALGLTSSDPTWGPIAFWSGVLGADLGFAGTLTWGYLKLEE